METLASKPVTHPPKATQATDLPQASFP